MKWENIRNIFGIDCHKFTTDTPKAEPRPLSQREVRWIKDIFQASDGWQNADISHTRVVSEDWCGEYNVSRCLGLTAPKPENPHITPKFRSIGQLWINTADGCVLNIQLSQLEGQLQELYALYIDPKNPARKLPESFTVVSFEAVTL